MCSRFSAAWLGSASAADFSPVIISTFRSRDQPWPRFKLQHSLQCDVSILCPGIPGPLYRVRGQASIPRAKLLLLLHTGAPRSHVSSPCWLTASTKNLRNRKSWNWKKGHLTQHFSILICAEFRGMALATNSHSVNRGGPEILHFLPAPR